MIYLNGTKIPFRQRWGNGRSPEYRNGNLIPLRSLVLGWSFLKRFDHFYLCIPLHLIHTISKMVTLSPSIIVIRIYISYLMIYLSIFSVLASVSLSKGSVCIRTFVKRKFSFILASIFFVKSWAFSILSSLSTLMCISINMVDPL